jgi:hypothetical protein
MAYPISMKTPWLQSILLMPNWGKTYLIHCLPGIRTNLTLDNNYSIDSLPLEHYNHMDKLGGVYNAECDELTKAYSTLKNHCTMASYEAGEAHT